MNILGTFGHLVLVNIGYQVVTYLQDKVLEMFLVWQCRKSTGLGPIKLGSKPALS